MIVHDVEGIAVVGRRVDRVEAARDVIDLPHRELDLVGMRRPTAASALRPVTRDPGGANSVTR